MMAYFFNDTATTEIYTLSLHDALPICASATRSKAIASGPVRVWVSLGASGARAAAATAATSRGSIIDRKSTRLNSSHANISYAVFCLTKKKPGRRGSGGPTTLRIEDVG